jgi:hypothetical protein
MSKAAKIGFGSTASASGVPAKSNVPTLQFQYPVPPKAAADVKVPLVKPEKKGSVEPSSAPSVPPFVAAYRKLFQTAQRDSKNLCREMCEAAKGQSQMARDRKSKGTENDLTNRRQKRLDKILNHQDHRNKTITIRSFWEALKPDSAYLTGSAAWDIVFNSGSASPWSDHDVTFEFGTQAAFDAAFLVYLEAKFPGESLDRQIAKFCHRRENGTFIDRIPGGIAFRIEGTLIDVTVRFKDQQSEATTRFSDLGSSCRVYFDKKKEHYELPLPGTMIKRFQDAKISYHPRDINGLLGRAVHARKKHNYLVQPALLETPSLRTQLGLMDTPERQRFFVRIVDLAIVRNTNIPDQERSRVMNNALEACGLLPTVLLLDRQQQLAWHLCNNDIPLSYDLIRQALPLLPAVELLALLSKLDLTSDADAAASLLLVELTQYYAKARNPDNTTWVFRGILASLEDTAKAISCFAKAYDAHPEWLDRYLKVEHWEKLKLLYPVASPALAEKLLQVWEKLLAQKSSEEALLLVENDVALLGEMHCGPKRLALQAQLKKIDVERLKQTLPQRWKNYLTCPTSETRAQLVEALSLFAINEHVGIRALLALENKDIAEAERAFALLAGDAIQALQKIIDAWLTKQSAEAPVLACYIAAQLRDVDRAVRLYKNLSPSVLQHPLLKRVFLRHPACVIPVIDYLSKQGRSNLAFIDAGLAILSDSKGKEIVGCFEKLTEVSPKVIKNNATALSVAKKLISLAERPDFADATVGPLAANLAEVLTDVELCTKLRSLAVVVSKPVAPREIEILPQMIAMPSPVRQRVDVAVQKILAFCAEDHKPNWETAWADRANSIIDDLVEAAKEAGSDGALNKEISALLRFLFSPSFKIAGFPEGNARTILYFAVLCACLPKNAKPSPTELQRVIMIFRLIGKISEPISLGVLAKFYVHLTKLNSSQRLLGLQKKATVLKSMLKYLRGIDKSLTDQFWADVLQAFYLMRNDQDPTFFRFARSEGGNVALQSIPKAADIAEPKGAVAQPAVVDNATTLLQPEVISNNSRIEAAFQYMAIQLEKGEGIRTEPILDCFNALLSNILIFRQEIAHGNIEPSKRVQLFLQRSLLKGWINQGNPAEKLEPEDSGFGIIPPQYFNALREQTLLALLPLGLQASDMQSYIVNEFVKISPDDQLVNELFAPLAEYYEDLIWHRERQIMSAVPPPQKLQPQPKRVVNSSVSRILFAAKTRWERKHAEGLYEKVKMLNFRIVAPDWLQAKDAKVLKKTAPSEAKEVFRQQLEEFVKIEDPILQLTQALEIPMAAAEEHAVACRKVAARASLDAMCQVEKQFSNIAKPSASKALAQHYNRELLTILLGGVLSLPETAHGTRQIKVDDLQRAQVMVAVALMPDSKTPKKDEVQRLKLYLTTIGDDKIRREVLLPLRAYYAELLSLDKELLAAEEAPRASDPPATCLESILTSLRGFGNYLPHAKGLYAVACKRGLTFSESFDSSWLK